MKTIRSLCLFWAERDAVTGASLGASEADGLIFYGYWHEGYSKNITREISSFKKIWSNRNSFKCMNWEGGENCNFSIEMKINSWPKKRNWISFIRLSLEWFSDRGAILSWCGTEYGSPSIVNFFPGKEGGNVYAAFSREVGFFCGSGLYEEYKDLDDICLDRFYKKLFSGKD